MEGLIGGSGPEMIDFSCDLLRLSNMDEKVHGIRNEFEHPSDFVLICTRANSEYTRYS